MYSILLDIIEFNLDKRLILSNHIDISGFKKKKCCL